MPLFLSLVVALSSQAPIGPSVPAGANPSFYRTFIKVQEALHAGNKAEAQRQLTLLPRGDFALEWDDANVPAGEREHLAGLRESALEEWLFVLKSKRPKAVAEKGDLKISFAKALQGADGTPVGATHVFGDEPGKPRLHTIIALQRGNPSQPTTATEVRNEVMFAIAAYLGLERTPFPGNAAFRTDLTGAGQNRIGATDATIFAKLMPAVEKLAALVAEGKPVVPAIPKMVVEPGRFDLPKTVQGEPVRYKFKVSNPGNAPLHFRFTPDCGCIAAHHGPVVEPGKSADVEGFLDSVNFVGELRHKFYVYSNDPEMPYREVPVNIDVEPLYRFVREGPSVLQVGERGTDAELYVLLSDKAKFTVSEARLQGVSKGSATLEPWEGEISPAPGQPKVKAKGYKINIHLDPAPVPGRTLTNVDLTTDSPLFPSLRYPLFSQKGIVAIPEGVYFGEVSRSEAVASTTISRPGVPFKITKIEASVPYLKGTSTDLGKGDEYKISIRYTGASEFGPMNATVTVFTDDPKQPKIVIGVTGLVR